MSDTGRADDQPGIVRADFSDEDRAEISLRPKKLDAFIGQEDLRRNLSVFIAAARARGEAVDHILFHGPPGLGKTTLAQIVAHEAEVGFRATSGPVIAKAGDLAALLTNLKPRDVLFIDEIHRLNPAIEEILYPAMEDYQLDLIIGEGPAARSLRIDLPPFTLIGATTRSGLVTRPLRERFGIPLQVSFYTEDDLLSIILRGGCLLGLELDSAGGREIARRSRGTPRIANRLLRRVRDFAQIDHCSSIDAEVAGRALSLLDVDSLGFDALDRRYLRSLAEKFDGGPTGVETLCAALSEERDTVEDVIEPYLIQQGFLQRTPRGRLLTVAAFEFLGLSAPLRLQSDFQADFQVGLPLSSGPDSEESND